MNAQSRAIAFGTALPVQAPSPVPGLGPDGRVSTIAAWPQGQFSPVPVGHTVGSALATSLALLRLCADEIEQRGGRATVIRSHIAECEPLV